MDSPLLFFAERRADMENETPKNPREEKTEEPHLAPVVSGKVSIKKKTEGQKFLETFFKGDVTQVGSGIWSDVIVPRIRDILLAAWEGAGRGLIMGDFDGGDRRGSDRNSVPARQVDFTRYSKRPERRVDYYRDMEDVYNYGEITVETRRDAEAILDRMNELIDTYHWVSVAQLYELSGLPSKYTDRNYGWRDRDLHDAYITTVRTGYMIKLPRPRPID